jgi:RHS repeat-associated protein
VDCLFGFTGEPLDPAGTGLQNNGQRWYEAGTGGWLSQDPTGLGAGDTDLYRYCGNSPTNMTDPSGLGPVVPGAPPAAVPPPSVPANEYVRIPGWGYVTVGPATGYGAGSYDASGNPAQLCPPPEPIVPSAPTVAPLYEWLTPPARPAEPRPPTPEEVQKFIKDAGY